MKYLYRPCPICENLHGEILHKQKFSLPSNSPLPSELDIVSCMDCGFVYADTPSKQKTYNEYYTLLSKYEELEIASGSGTSVYDNKRLESTTLTIKRIVPDSSKSILDMGCANGGLLNSLKNSGYKNIMGIDPSLKCNNHVKSLGIECIQGDIFSESFKQLPQSFDCIILTHVLEHICDLSIALENLSSKLNDNGILYIEVPDASRYMDYYIVPFYYIDCEHINHFDHHSLSNLITSRGFVQIETKNIEFKVNETNSYPAIYSAFKKSGTSPEKYTFSTIAKESFLAFIAESNQNDDNDIIIDQLVKNQEPIIIWGAGQFTLRLLANTDLPKCNVRGFIDSDSNKHGNKILGYSIFAPDYLLDKDISILICSALHHSDILKTINKLYCNRNTYVLK